ncbi:Tat (twin-arginine translocation) pathway signal sequence [Neorhodopirellula lusitana]|uniref:Tat (Twin-arginine translocation) pathway signal sequence n=1 Tax=Neorhodopirellula lusitana TaxID=445327 RepID=A0ABY1QMD4_9BACT|nr:SGNH/GDSL hydrolase family protein [Neorhodopirellula lusitana]SMP72270.1 Tat (twin-arginine translocation) pathway signal sequence [Neorhodopirellula lusitana]
MPESNMPTRRVFIKATAVAGGALSFGTAASGDQPDQVSVGVAGYQYRLPNLKKGSRLLFQGDSITDMKWGRNQSDRNHYLGHSYVYLIASRLGVDMPAAKLEFFNRGNSGNTVSQLRERWQTDAIELQPDVLSILIGVNDVGRAIRSGQGQVPLEEWEQDYRAILDASRSANADLRIVLLDPFVLPAKRFGDGNYAKWRTQVDQLREIVGVLAKDYEAVHIHTQQIFDDATKVAAPEHWIWDGVHPLPQGHELIARNWLEKMS